MAKKKTKPTEQSEVSTSDASREDREKALASTLTELTKRYGEGTVVKLGDARHLEVDTIPTGSLAVDIALGVGGVPRGRITEVYGPESSGKTTLCLSVVAQAQKRGGICAFVDMEHALDPNYCVQLGVDVDNLYISQPDTGEQAMEIVEELIRSGAIDVIVLDSVAALVPRAEIEGEMGDSHVGLQARLMSQALRKISGAIKQTNTAFLVTNQLREKIGVMYGCFQYSSRVVLADGRKMKIGKIVNQRMDVEVLSYDERTRSFEPRRIVNWFENGNANYFLQFVVENNRHRGRSEFACTPNHRLLTEKGYMAAGDLQIGDNLVTAVKHYLTPAHEQVVYGSVLGDGQLRYTSEHNVQLRIGHGPRQTEYCRWKQSLFESISIHEEVHVSGGLYWDTISMYELAQIHAMTYSNGKKNPNQEIVDRLSPLAIAIWYMDDGTFDKSRQNRCSIAASGFSKETQQALVKWFQQNGIDAHLTVRGLINFAIEATRNLHEMIAPYVHPSMDYKLMPEFRGLFRPLKLDPCERVEAVAMPILDIYVKPATRSMRRFDIEVEGNHSYLVDNVVVHNSNETTTGGRALRFYASVRIDIRRIQSIKQGEEIIGNRTRVKITKNKVAPPFRQAEFDLLYGEGFSIEGDVLDLGTELGIVEKRGAFYRYNDGLIGQGRENAKQYLRQNPDLLYELETLVRQQYATSVVPMAAGSSGDDDEGYLGED